MLNLGQIFITIEAYHDGKLHFLLTSLEYCD